MKKRPNEHLVLRSQSCDPWEVFIHRARWGLIGGTLVLVIGLAGGW